MFLDIPANFDDDELFFFWNGRPKEGFKTYFQPRPMSEILTITNVLHTASRT